MYRDQDVQAGKELRRSDAWHALYTRHQHEKTIARLLAMKNFEVFLPLYGVVRQWKDRKKSLQLPLFPTYVFVRGGIERQLEILTTPGVYGWVGNEGRPVSIPREEIAAVRQVVESPLRIEPHPFLKCGDRVRVKYGPLAGLEGLLVRKKNQFQLVLSVEAMQRSAAVEVEGSEVERIFTADGAAIPEHEEALVARA
jgi:transcription antitermination factor NusG